MIVTYRYRLKEATAGTHLDQMARAVNRVRNYCSEVRDASRWHNQRWPSAFDLIKPTTDGAAMLGLHSDTVQAVCKRYVEEQRAASLA
jgi:putative transposase